MDKAEMSFWDHLDVLRASIIRMVVAAATLSIVAFLLKDTLFSVVLAPKNSSFITYRWLDVEPFNLQLVNTGLTGQFMIHMEVALMVGILAASPYIVYLLYRFVAPALYENERHWSVRITVAAYVMFWMGLVVNYFLIFPLTVHFLGTYQVSQGVTNLLTISSYVETLGMLSLVFGIIFEIPVLAWILGRAGLIRSEWMQRYRRQAIVIILIAAAVITPTGDMLTLLIVSLPIWLLYEASIWIVRKTS